MDKHRLIEDRVLMVIFGPKRELTGGWRKLHTEELYNLYSSSYIFKVIKLKTVKWQNI
jgi:hypothetical protein